MKKIGLIGGMTYISTIDYYRYINEGVMKKRGTNPSLLIYSLTQEKKKGHDWSAIEKTFLDIAQKLERAGADAIVICANTSHKVVPFVAPKINIPFLHIAEGTGNQAIKLGMKKIGLLGTRAVTEDDFITGPLEKDFDLEVLISDPPSRVKMDEIINQELAVGIATAASKKFLLDEMEKLKAQGAEGIVLGCTDFPVLVNDEDFDLPLLDTTFLHAQAAIEFILS